MGADLLRATSFAAPRPLAAVDRLESRVNPVVRAAFYLFVLSIPFEIPHRGAIPVEIPTIIGCLLLLTTILNPSECFRRIPGALVALVAFFGLLAVGIVVHHVVYGPDLIRFFGNMILLLLLMWVMFNLLADERTLRGVLIAFALACSIRAGVQVAGFGDMVSPESMRVTAFGQNPNIAAMILTGGMVTLIGMQLAPGKRLPRFGLLTWPLVAIIVVAVIQGGSRGGLLCTLVGAGMFALRGPTFVAKLRNVLFALLVVGAIVWGAYQDPMMRERFKEAEAGQLAGREKMYPLLLDILSERPVFGWGPVGNEYELGRRLRDPRFISRDPHNIVFEVLTSAGIIGSIPFFIGLGLCAAAGWRARHGILGIMPLAMFAAVLTGTMSGTWLASKILWLSLTLALAAGAHWSAPSYWVPRGVR